MPEPVWNDDDMARSVAEAGVNVKGIARQRRGRQWEKLKAEIRSARTEDTERERKSERKK
jgi:hypothetical protein